MLTAKHGGFPGAICNSVNISMDRIHCNIVDTISVYSSVPGNVAGSDDSSWLSCQLATPHESRLHRLSNCVLTSTTPFLRLPMLQGLPPATSLPCSGNRSLALLPLRSECPACWTDLHAMLEHAAVAGAQSAILFLGASSIQSRPETASLALLQLIFNAVSKMVSESFW